jgi:hypothetical protein
MREDLDLFGDASVVPRCPFPRLRVASKASSRAGFERSGTRGVPGGAIPQRVNREANIH